MTDNTDPKHRVVCHARELGFDLVKIAPVQLPAHHLETFRSWVEEGCHGSMTYLSRAPDRPRTATQILPEAQSVISLGVNYYRHDSRPARPSEGWVSRYAVTRDYHRVIGKKLKLLCAFLTTEFDAVARGYVDTGPILERAYSEAATVGYVGKNSCLITREFGSWVFLAEVVTTLALRPDTDKIGMSCGRCRKCIDACPTNAIRADRTIDAPKCISYLTIENRGPIPVPLRAAVGQWLFGCDICQEVCPHNGRAQPIRVDNAAEIRIQDRLLSLAELLAIDSDEEFHRRFAGTPLMRAKRRGMIRNACVVAGNSRQEKLLPSLERIANGDDEMLAEHARWAIDRIGAAVPGKEVLSVTNDSSSTRESRQ